MNFRMKPQREFPIISKNMVFKEKRKSLKLNGEGNY